MNGAATGLRKAGIVLNLKLLVNSASTGGLGPLMIVRPSSNTPIPLCLRCLRAQKQRMSWLLRFFYCSYLPGVILEYSVRVVAEFSKLG